MVLPYLFVRRKVLFIAEFLNADNSLLMFDFREIVNALDLQ
tara:strand:+ start:917 stop:1039 length:123 start_codon:yes stop_codon:yes gene_type:complete